MAFCLVCDRAIVRRPSHIKRSKRHFCGKAHFYSQHSFGERHPLARLTWVQVGEIRSRYSPRKVMMKDLAKEYGVSYSCIHHILSGDTWTSTGSRGKPVWRTDAAKAYRQ